MGLYTYVTLFLILYYNVDVQIGKEVGRHNVLQTKSVIIIALQRSSTL